MPDRDDQSGGTPGASVVVSPLLATHYRYSQQDLDSIRQFWSPSESWLAEMRGIWPEDLIEALPPDEQLELKETVSDVLDGSSRLNSMASDFLRRSESSAGKATAAMQKLYLEKIHQLADELAALITDVSVTGTPADLFAFARQRFNKTDAFQVEMELLAGLAIVSALAKFRLRNRTLPDEKEVHAIRGKSTLDRFRFSSSVISFYESSTGKVATAWTNESADGIKTSEAVGFLMAVVNPVVAYAGLAPMSPETARKEIEGIKRSLSLGIDPGQPHFGLGYDK